MSLTVDPALLAEVDHVHEQLLAGRARETSRVPAFAGGTPGYHSRRAFLHPLLAAGTALDRRRQNTPVSASIGTFTIGQPLTGEDKTQVQVLA